jgi:beta-galactosidase
MTTVGAQYYRPPNPPREDWARDLGRMRDAGMNTVKFWACWSWVNSAEGHNDFADLDELMDHASDAGLRVVINTIIENAPYWLEEKYPQARYVDSEGRAVHLTAAMNTPGGGWPGLCFDNDEVWGEAAAFLDTLVRRYDRHPALTVWDVWNEPHLEPASYFPERIYCYCDASVARFTAWLQRKYASLDALNESWSRRYSSWSQVQPPRIFEAVPDLLDWRSFWFDNLAEWLARRCEVVRAASEGTTVMTHVALSGFTGQLATHSLDEFALTEPVDVFGTSSFPTWLMADDPVEHLFNLDTARDAAAGKPFWQAELQGGRGRRAGLESTGQPHPDVVRLWMWNALAAGATGIMFWQWRPELLGPESPGYGLTTPDGSLTDRVAAASELAAIAQLPDLRGSTPEAPAVGLVVSRLSALHAFATDRTMDLYRDSVLGAYRLLIDADRAPSILHEDRLIADGVPEHIRAIYWPMPAVADARLAAALAAFVRRGGRLVSEASPGEYDASGRRRPSGSLLELENLFGVRQGETTSTARESIAVDGGSIEVAWQRESLLLDAAESRGTFGDGAAAVTRNAFGAGEGIRIASYPSLAYAASRDAATREALAALLDAGGTGAWAHPAPGLMTRRVRFADGGAGTFALNWTDSAGALAAPGVLLAGALHGDAVPARSGVLMRHH